MTEIIPFRAWRYHAKFTKNIDELICPPFDVVSESQKRDLYLNPLNSIHLSVPQGNHPANDAALRLEKWKKDQTIVQDKDPGIYVYYQYFTLPEQKKIYVRKGFICLIRAYYWNEGMVMRHEDTMPFSVDDRLELLAATQLNVSPTHGLYTDPGFKLERYMDECMKHPIYEAEDFQGVRDVLGVIREPTLIRMFIETMKFSKIILADGHHRYESSLLYRKKQTQLNRNHTGQELYNFHMMYLTNTEAAELQIFPTHRLILNNSTDIKTILDKGRKYFRISLVTKAEDVPKLIAGKSLTFGMVTRNESYILELKQDALESLETDFPKELVETDILALHLIFIQELLNKPYDLQRTDRNLVYERNFDACLEKLKNNDVDLALVTNGVTVEQVKNICYNGYMLPQKSTYFYPKAICGYVFGSLNDNEK